MKSWKREVSVVTVHEELLLVQELHEGGVKKTRTAQLDDLKRAASAQGYELKVKCSTESDAG